LKKRRRVKTRNLRGVDRLPKATEAALKGPETAQLWSPKRSLLGEETEILRKAIEVAKAGDVQMLKFFLDRLLPRERLIKIDIPRLDFANDAVEAMMVISEMLANGQITPSEAASIASLIAGYARTIEITDLSNRVDALEASLEPKE
jgi:hypothetical protein